LKNHQRRLEAEYHIAARAARKALQELDMAKLELASVAARRELAAKQLELATQGISGIDWSSSTNDSVLA
jgi:hypothetical protein